MTEQLQYFAAVADDGTLKGIPQKKLRAELRRLFAGKQIEILIHRKRKHRSINQNRYYWLTLASLSDHTGFTREELHAILKQKFLLTEKVHEDTGVVYEYVKSTTELTTVEMEEYLESVRRFAAEEFSIELPLPNEQVDVFTHGAKSEMV